MLSAQSHTNGGQEMTSKESTQIHHLEESKQLPAPQANRAHLFIEDSNQNVIERILIPRPTSDPKDPLTWGKWRKHLAYVGLSFFVFLSNFVTASISPALVTIAVEFNVDITKASYWLTLNILFLGLGNLFWVPIALKIGKRPVFIMTSAIFFGSCIWSARAQSWGSMLASRIIQGFGASASEALGPAVVADLYFLHERGTMVGFYTFMIASGSAFGGIFAGLVVGANPDWRWIFWMDSILTGVCMVVIILFQPETNFIRPADTEDGGETEQAVTTQQGQYSWKQSLGLFAWYDRDVSMLRLFWRPFTVLFYPAVIWGSLVYGIVLAWVVLQQTANPSFFPVLYGYSGHAVGNISVASLIGAVIGCIAGGPCSDYVVIFITKRRNGYFQPEFRLWTLFPAFLFAPIGLIIWGVGLRNHLHPMVAIAGTGITYGVLCAVPSIAMTYVVDCYRPLAGETMTILTAFKNVFAFGLSFAVIPWIMKDGFVKVAGYNLLIEGIIFATTIPMYIYGERLRQ